MFYREPLAATRCQAIRCLAPNPIIETDITTESPV